MRYCYERTVTNHHATAPLRFEWPVGRLRADSLALGEPTRTCTYYGEPNTRDGLLHYGRGNSNTPTKIWEGQTEPAPATLTTIVEVVALVSGEKWPAKVSLVSSAKKASASGFEYRYELSFRPGSKELAVSWLSADSHGFRAELERTKQRSLLTLVSGKTLEVTFKSSDWPTVQGGDVLLYGGRDSTLLLTAGAAAYVPRQR